MEKMVEIMCTKEQLETIKTALRLEYERNYGHDPDVVNLLKSALEAAGNWKTRPG